MSDIDSKNSFLIRPIGVVRSELKRREDCPRQGFEGAPEAWLEIHPEFVDGLDGVESGTEVIVITWFHKAERNVLKVHPRGNQQNQLRGVFSTRSPDRPNPLGLHRVEILEIRERGGLRVRPLEALNGTPIVDIKPIIWESRDM